MLRGMGGTLFKNILVPVDFSACSTEAFQVAWQLAAALGARITVMHVIDVNAVEAFNRLGLLAVPSDAARQRKRLPLAWARANTPARLPPASPP